MGENRLIHEIRRLVRPPWAGTPSSPGPRETPSWRPWRDGLPGDALHQRMSSCWEGAGPGESHRRALFACPEFLMIVRRYRDRGGWWISPERSLATARLPVSTGWLKYEVRANSQLHAQT